MTTELVEVCIPREPECWQSCGTCRTEHFRITDLLAGVGDEVHSYQPLMIAEAYKTELEIVSPVSGTLVALLAYIDDEVAPGETVALVDPG